MKERFSLIVILLLGLAQGCGGSEVADNDMMPFDVIGEVREVALPLNKPDLFDEAEEDLVDEDPEQADLKVGFDSEVEVTESEFGTPCRVNSDCPSGFCIPEVDGEGAFCTILCVTECPEGLSCRLAPQAKPDPVYICMPPYEAPFCRPCQSTSDCDELYSPEELECIEVSPEAGSFCTSSCSIDQDCPEPLGCVDGACLPEQGCTCLESSGSRGRETDCTIANEAGACAGVRVCGEDGMSVCSAAVPTEEVCDLEDNDCDGLVDEGQDSRACSSSNQWGACSGTEACLDGAWLCDASEAAEEVCDGIDNDCDGEIDEVPSAGACEISNQFGTCLGVRVCADGTWKCAAKVPEAEVCDGQDNDCDTFIDEQNALGCSSAYPDLDVDGWGGEPAICVCSIGPFHSGLPGDCNDSLKLINPGMDEQCDGIDNDCDGLVDENCDEDEDGFCAVVQPGGSRPLPCSATMLDCDDGNPRVNPAASELCDGLDNNCDAQIDELCDLDDDGFCSGERPNPCPPTLIPHSCDESAYPLPESCFRGYQDCDDTDPGVKPGAVEVCDFKDNNCNGIVDEGMDLDGDGFCAGSGGDFNICCPLGSGDCNDLDSSVNPAALDNPDDQLTDSNCDGMDGDVAAAIFVSASLGFDSSPGTYFLPKKTIQAGIQEADVNPDKNQVIVADGTYHENLNLREGVSVYGSYSMVGGWHRTNPEAGPTTIIEGGTTAVKGIGIMAQTSLQNLEIRSADASVQNGASIGVQLTDSNGVMLRRVVVRSGKGGNGTNGVNGTDGAAGNNGMHGARGCDSSSCLFSDDHCESNLPAGGSGPELTCGGRGQAIYTVWVDFDMSAPYPWQQGEEGENSCWYTYNGPGEGGRGGHGGLASHPLGWNGQDGADGDNGQGGNRAIDSYSSNSGWSVPWATNGASGEHGYGGGGGGRGRAYTAVWYECNSIGGEGGGGGSGGLKGTAGTGGRSGASSIGVLAHHSVVSIRYSRIYTENGGKGGNGGLGGKGGDGGLGGLGGDGWEGSHRGGNGGAGGDGGSGGGGGGGNGGHSVGVLYTCGDAPTIIQTTYSLGQAGAGGQGGASTGNPGASGHAGTRANSLCLN